MLHRDRSHSLWSATSSVIDHAAGNLFRTGRIGFIGFAPTPPTGAVPHHPPIGLMDAGDIRVSVGQTEARIIGHDPMVMTSRRNSQRAWNRIERVYGNRTRIISLEDWRH